MLFQASVKKDKRTDYQSAAWEPQVELLQSPPRWVSFSARFKLVAAVLLLVTVFMVCVAILPWLKYAYLTSFGVATKGIIEQRYSRENLKTRANSYFLIVRYETPSGWQLVRIQTSRTFYTRNFQGESVSLHFLARLPSQCVLDGEQVYRPWPGLFVVGFWVLFLWLQCYLYLKMRSLVVFGTPVKGLITKINQGPRTRYLTVYYEFQGVPYEGQIAVRPNRAKPEWQPGKVISLLVSDPPSKSRGARPVVVYPASEFKINQ
jgi:hypothetical protein